MAAEGTSLPRPTGGARTSIKRTDDRTSTGAASVLTQAIPCITSDLTKGLTLARGPSAAASVRKRLRTSVIKKATKEFTLEKRRSSARPVVKRLRLKAVYTRIGRYIASDRHPPMCVVAVKGGLNKILVSRRRREGKYFIENKRP